MSLHPQQIGEVPEETARVAKACFPKGDRSMRLRATLGTIFADHEFADLFPPKGQPAEARLPIGTGLPGAVHGRADQSASSRCRTLSHEYQLFARIGPDRSRLRFSCTLPVSHSPS
jgi:hypothetical protein